MKNTNIKKKLKNMEKKRKEGIKKLDAKIKERGKERTLTIGIDIAVITNGGVMQTINNSRN